jgi:hypothetical protein
MAMILLLFEIGLKHCERHIKPCADYYTENKPVHDFREVVRKKTERNKKYRRSWRILEMIKPVFGGTENILSVYYTACGRIVHMKIMHVETMVFQFA